MCIILNGKHLNAILVESPSTSVGGFSFLVKEELIVGLQEDGYNFNEIKFTMDHRSDFRVLTGVRNPTIVCLLALFLIPLRLKLGIPAMLREMRQFITN